MTELLAQIFAVDGNTAVIIGALTAVGCGIVWTLCSSLTLGILLGPGLLVGALLARHIAATNGLDLTPDRDVNSVMAAAAGLVIALMLQLSLIYLWSSFRDRKRPAVAPSVAQRRRVV